VIAFVLIRALLGTLGGLTGSVVRSSRLLCLVSRFTSISIMRKVPLSSWPRPPSFSGSYHMCDDAISTCGSPC